MAGRIRIPPYKPLGIDAQGVPGGGYYDIDAHAGQFNALPPVQLGLQAAQAAAGIAGVLSEHLGGDNEATVKAADTRLGEAEQTLLFDPQSCAARWARRGRRCASGPSARAGTRR